MYCSLGPGLVLAVAGVGIGIANAAVQSVSVGEGGTLKFNPDSLTAAVGDQ